VPEFVNVMYSVSEVRNWPHCPGLGTSLCTEGLKTILCRKCTLL